MRSEGWIERFFAEKGYVRTGELVETEDTEWWCPTSRSWVWCPGPCPDGTPHEETRTTTVLSQRWERGNGPRRLSSEGRSTPARRGEPGHRQVPYQQQIETKGG